MTSPEWRKFDPDDRTTWPKQGERVLVAGADGHVQVLSLEFYEHGAANWKWRADDEYQHDIGEYEVAWMGLPAYEPTAVSTGG